MKNKIFKFQIKNLIFSGVFAIIILLASITSNFWNPLSDLDNNINDAIYQHKGTAAKEIYIVGIDDETIEEYGMYNAIEYRDYIADALNMWADNSCVPAAIGFDMIFNKAYGCDTVDIKLRDAMLRHNVILGVNGMSRSEAPYGLSEEIYNGAKGIGYVDAITDNDEAVRRTYLKGLGYNSLAYAMYEQYANNTGKELNDYENKMAYYFNYYAAPELNYTGDGKIQDVVSGFNYISFKDLIEDEIVIRSNSIVIFGSYASAVDTGLSNDIFNSPIGEMFGVEIQCNIIQSLLNDELYLPINSALWTTLNVVIIFVISFLMTSFVFYLATVVFAAGIGLEFLLMVIMHSAKVYHFVSLPILILILAFVSLIVYHYYSEYKHKKEVIGTFKRYISPDVAEALVDKQEDALMLGGRKRNVACLFVDIRGFTKMSEELSPEEVVDILNGYLEMATKQVFKYGGMVDKFIGDCVMAIFNAPVDLDDYIYKAVCAAYGIVHVGKAICEEVEKKYNKQLKYGVGVHFGDAVIGNIGSKTRMDFTAIGDTVNTASRIEASAAGDQVLISSDVYEVLKDRIKVVDAGDRMFKNKKEPIKCYEVIEIDGYSND
ncbi:MAG: adenylate/guanylate cyclase domain-containing protein [Acholeplasmatales bacterium]|nr:adenylate/guanylate cyclase domain-containing protein [Acholeplasmatales bacterium]